MPWLPPSATVRSQPFAHWYEQLIENPTALRDFCAALRVKSEAGPVNYFKIRDLLSRLRATRDLLDEAAQVGAGLRQFIADQRGGTAGEVQADFVAMRGAVVDLISWTITNLPSSPPYLLVVSLTSDGEEVPREFGSVAMAEFRTRLAALEAAIG